jgi:LuxR family transcriptional regulator, maltose regulon positive regulatory protein
LHWSGAQRLASQVWTARAMALALKTSSMLGKLANATARLRPPPLWSNLPSLRGFPPVNPEHGPEVFVHRLKLRPPPTQATWLARPTLESQLQEDVRVLSIVAGPGYGKTVLAARLYDAWAGPKLWYSLEPADTDLAVFGIHLDSLTRSIQGLKPFGSELSRLGSPKDVGALFAESVAEKNGRLLLVFDDVHVLRGSRSLSALGELIERAARGGATFVLCGRAMPLPLHAFAASMQLVTLTASELAFGPNESYEYLRRVMRNPPERSRALEMMQRAEGWPAGLALMATTAAHLASSDPVAPGEAADAPGQQVLFDYLASEALADLSEAERAFLLESSILDRLEVGLCDLLLERHDSGQLLASIARRGLFVARGDRETYACHQLFREFLRDSLKRSRSRSDVDGLHRRASSILEKRGEFADAISHLLDAGEPDEASAMLDRYALALLRLGLTSAVGRLLERIDADRIAARPALLMARGCVLRERGDWDAALAVLERGSLAARRCGAFDVLTESIRLCAPILASRGEFDRVLQLLDSALELGAQLSDENTTTLRMTQAAVFVEIERYD